MRIGRTLAVCTAEPLASPVPARDDEPTAPEPVVEAVVVGQEPAWTPHIRTGVR